MSMVPGLAEVLGERLGRPADEMKALLRSCLVEMSKRQWRSLTPAQAKAHELEIQRQMRRGLPEITAEDIQKIPLSQLPAFARRCRDIAGRARRQWWAAYSNYEEMANLKEQELRRKGVSSKRARDEARRLPKVMEAGERSLSLKERSRHMEAIADNALHEMEARIELAKSGQLQDPELVFVGSH